MPELLRDSAVTATTAPKLNGGRALVVGGRAQGARLLELAQWSGIADADISVLLPAAQTLLQGEDALAQLCALPAQDTTLQPMRLLRSIVDARATTLVVAYPNDAPQRAEFALALQRLRAEVDLNMIVYLERHQRPWRRILVPYLSACLDDAALQFALRSSAAVTLLHTIERRDDTAPAPLRAQLEHTHGCVVQVVEADDPFVAAALEAQWGYDLVVVGGGQNLPGRSFSMRQQRMLLATDLSLVVVHSPH